MDKYDIGGHVLWETEVTEATWDDATATWSVRARDCNGATTTLSARAVINAVGQLNRPPSDIEGQRDFAGPAFTRWDHTVDLRGSGSR
jgi:4-hydroxyacetophenone monooxygenase